MNPREEPQPSAGCWQIVSHMTEGQKSIIPNPLATLASRGYKGRAHMPHIINFPQHTRIYKEDIAKLRLNNLNTIKHQVISHFHRSQEKPLENSNFTVQYCIYYWYFTIIKYDFFCILWSVNIVYKLTSAWSMKSYLTSCVMGLAVWQKKSFTTHFMTLPIPYNNHVYKKGEVMKKLQSKNEKLLSKTAKTK